MPERSIIVVQLTTPTGKAERIEDAVRDAIAPYDDGTIGFRVTAGTPPKDILKAVDLFEWPHLPKGART